MLSAIRAGSLRAVFEKIPDPRQPQGRRNSHATMLTAVVCDILCGIRGGDVLAQWARSLDVRFWHLLGFRRRSPCANTFRDLLKRISADVLEQALRQWMIGILGELPILPGSSSVDSSGRQWMIGILGELPDDAQQLVAMDGKTLCGTLQPHSASVHLLALLDHQTKCVLSQQAVDGKTNEANAALELLKTVELKGRVISGDAMFCQRDICQQVIDGAATT